MLPQYAMIDRLRGLCQQDPRLVAAMLYGSFTLREADAYSDIDVMLFFADERLPEIDQRDWVSQIAPLELYYHNEYGNGVAIFENLVRAEFHFDPASQMGKIESLREFIWFPVLEDSLLVDKTGQLSVHLQVLNPPPPPHQSAQDVRYLCDNLINWCLFGTNVLSRGELARALEILNVVQDPLLLLARLAENRPERWINPVRAFEKEISPESYRRYQTCTAPLEREGLWRAYLNAWEWGNELLAVLAKRHQTSLPAALIERLSQRFEEEYRANGGENQP